MLDLQPAPHKLKLIDQAYGIMPFRSFANLGFCTAETEAFAGHCESCPAWWSRTGLTARSRTSEEYFIHPLPPPGDSAIVVSGIPGAAQSTR